jgi:hypothetical protein
MHASALSLALLAATCAAPPPPPPALAAPAPAAPAPTPAPAAPPAPAPPAPAPPAPAPPASASASAPAPPPPPKTPALIYQNTTDSTFGASGHPLDGPVPPSYERVPVGAPPGSLRALLAHRSRVFVRQEGVECRPLVIDRIATRGAEVHEDEVTNWEVSGACAVRYPAQLDYTPGAFGVAAVDYRPGARRILRGCAGVGEGIALCGWPVLLVVGADEHRIRFVDARAHLGRTWQLYAYEPKVAIEWYFDAEDCARASAPTERGGCG